MMIRHRLIDSPERESLDEFKKAMCCRHSDAQKRHLTRGGALVPEYSSVLGNWDIRLVVPENVSVNSYARMKSIDALNFDIIRVTDQWMGDRIQRYNAMMLSTDFYRLFDDYEYILICHLDSWVFRDELEYWINLGYDYVGPPLFLLKEPARNSLESLVAPQGGNGGFCLRKIDSTVKLLSNKRYDLNVMLFLKGVIFLIRNRKFDLLKIFLRVCRKVIEILCDFS